MSASSILASEYFSAYSLGENEESSYCQNIVNPKTGMITQNYLDTVSEKLNADFQELYKLHSQTFARK